MWLSYFTADWAEVLRFLGELTERQAHLAKVFSGRQENHAIYGWFILYPPMQAA